MFSGDALVRTGRFGVPVAELFSCFGGKTKLFAVFTGYMDESVKGDWFVYSCLVGDNPMWMFVEWAWGNMLEKTNRELAAQGRKQLKRYKAADCSSCLGDFKGWTKDEQIKLTQDILKIFSNHPLHVFSYSLNLKELVKEIPRARPNPIRFSYALLLQFLMLEIGEAIADVPQFRDEKIALIHDRCSYDGVLLNSFNEAMRDKGFKRRKFFTTIAPMGWEDCVPLQPADLLAYENLKEAELKSGGNRRRKTLELLLDLDAFGGRAKNITPIILQKLWKERFNENSRRRFLKLCGIPSLQRFNRQSAKRNAHRTKGKTRR